MKRKYVVKIGANGGTQVGTGDPGVLVTIKQIARRYGISVRTAHNWKKEGRLGYYKLGRSIRFHPAECDEDIKSFRIPSRFRSTLSNQ